MYNGRTESARGSSLLVPYVATSLGALALLLAAWLRPRAGRVLYALLFLGAGAFNAVTALRTPDVYVQGFAPHAIGPFREFIERVVALAPDAIVLAIAIVQVLAGAAIAAGRGWVLVGGVVVAAMFLAALSWLGVGAAFPANLVMAAGALLLLRTPAGRR